MNEHLIGQTRTIAVSIRQANPCATLERIAEVVAEQTGEQKVSRQRIHQLLKREGKPTAGNPLRSRIVLKCNHCGEEYHIPKRYMRKDKGRATYRWQSMFCSKKCKKAYNIVTIICDFCGKRVHRPINRILGSNRYHKEHIFCNKKCQGLWLAINYGHGKGCTNRLRCAICHKVFYRSDSYLKTLHECHPNAQPLCSRKCSTEKAHRVLKKTIEERRIANSKTLICPICNTTFHRTDAYIKAAMKKRPNTTFVCSRKCQGVKGTQVRLQRKAQLQGLPNT